MDILQIVVLGLVQAVSEWLPLSSKTMDTLVYTKFFNGSSANVLPLLLFLHLGTLLAATIYFRKEIIRVLRNAIQHRHSVRLLKNSEFGYLFTALLFTGAIGLPILLAEKYLLPSLDASALMMVMGAGLIGTGFLLTTQHKNKWRNYESSNWQDGVLTGIMQGLSTLPGVSRAGTTTTALIWRGFDSESAFHLSFLLSIPTVFLAEMVLWGAQGGLALSPDLAITDGLLLALSSFVFGYITLDALLKLAHRVNVAWLAFAFGMLMLAAGLMGVG